MHLVVDTNVLVSGLLRAQCPSARIVNGLATGEFHLLYDDRIFLEYREVLARPRFGFDPSAVETLLRKLMEDGEAVAAAPMNIELPDEDDRAFIEVAATRGAVIVTGNRRHFPALPGVQILTPREFVDGLGQA